MTFEPKVRYYPTTGFLLYLTEDVSYRTEYVDSFLELLWHPQDDRMVGFKVSNVQLINRWFDGNFRTQYKELYLDSFLGCAMGLQNHSNSYAMAQAAAKYCHACDVYGEVLIPDDARKAMQVVGEA